MCIDTDLFQDVIITFSDVELWLKNSRIDNYATSNRVKAYINDYDIASKIRAAKLNGSFYALENNQIDVTLPSIQDHFCKYVEPETFKPCEAIFHICDNENCDIYKARLKRDYYRKKYLERKKERASHKAKRV
jgi:ribonucleotide reductase alpha subunit